LFSLPAARIADRWNRKYLLIAALLLWSAMTAAVSLANSFTTIAILRTGVAMGEAVCLPTVYSMLSDFFRPHQRARAIALFGMTYSVGSMIGIGGAGLLGEAFGWKTAFLLIGLTGLALAPVLAVWLREPPRSGIAADAEAPPRLARTFGILWRLRSFRYAAVGASLQCFVGVMILFWSTPFYVRTHGTSLGEIAVTLGALVGIAGAAGTLSSGLLGDRLGRRDDRWYLWLPALSSLLTLPFGLLQFLAGDLRIAIAFGIVTIFLANMWLSPTYAIAQALVGPRLRAVASATLVTGTAIASGAVGPSVIGELSDALDVRFGLHAQSLRFALCVALFVSLVAAGFFALSARYVRDDLRTAGKS